jgi:hypothetical protein
MVCLAQTMHLSCTKTNTVSKKEQNKFLHDPCYLGVPSVVSKTVFDAMGCLVQTLDLSCIDTNTISKWAKIRFYLTHIT